MNWPPFWSILADSLLGDSYTKPTSDTNRLSARFKSHPQLAACVRSLDFAMACCPPEGSAMRATAERTLRTETASLRWAEMRDAHAPLVDVVESFLVHRHDLSPATATNYRLAIRSFAEWTEQRLHSAAAAILAFAQATAAVCSRAVP